jgi:hypothetical protein
MAAQKTSFLQLFRIKLHCIRRDSSNFLTDHTSIGEGRIAGNFSERGRISARAAGAPGETERVAVIHNQEKPGGDVR